VDKAIIFGSFLVVILYIWFISSSIHYLFIHLFTHSFICLFLYPIFIEPLSYWMLCWIYPVTVLAFLETWI
jgi:hypothetical protein